VVGSSKLKKATILETKKKGNFFKEKVKHSCECDL
jgi:hypothetical protein